MGEIPTVHQQNRWTNSFDIMKFCSASERKETLIQRTQGISRLSCRCGQTEQCPWRHPMGSLWTCEHVRALGKDQLILNRAILLNYPGGPSEINGVFKSQEGGKKECWDMNTRLARAGFEHGGRGGVRLPKVGLGGSKANKQARLVERKTCFISEASSIVGG